MTQQIIPFRVGRWLPSDQSILEKWVKTLINEVEVHKKTFHPVIEEMKNFIEGDAEVFMLFNQMFKQIPRRFKTDPSGKPQVRDYLHFLELLNAIMTKAPEFNKTGVVGFPINAILDWPMGTTSGYAAFLNNKVNYYFKKVLNEWARFLGSKDSCETLNYDEHSGWFGKDAREAMPNFKDEFICDPLKDHYGFTSWDDFFTRQFREGIRPIADPDNDDIIVNACESAPYRVSYNVKRQDRFWIKAQPYSLEHLMKQDDYVDDFVGGTIYQAFLSALSYHRWHSPVSGIIVKAYTIDGTYYAETLSEGYDDAGPNESQGYIAQVASRALIFIEADNPAIGLMCFVSIGMAEVSSNEITVYEGQHVTKGQQLGMFHFGGSTHCLIFRPEVKLEFDLHGEVPGLESNNIPINSQIAEVCK